MQYILFAAGKFYILFPVCKFSFLCSVRILYFICSVRILYSVRVKGRMSLRNGIWNGVRNGIIMRNTIYAGNKLTEERNLFSRQFYKSSSFFDAADSC